MASELIKKARAKKNKHFDENIELALENVEQRIIADAEKGKSKTYIGFNSPGSNDLTVETMAKKYTDKFIESILDHFNLNKHQIKKIHNSRFLPSHIVGFEILWGEEYE